MMCVGLLDIHLSRSACGRLAPLDSDERSVAGDIRKITADRLASIKLAVRTLNSRSESSFGRRRQLDGAGQAISATQPAPVFSVNRKPCNLTMAETRLRPKPAPCVFRLLSDL